HDRARAYYVRRLPQTHGGEQQRLLFDYVFLHRDNPLFKPFIDWQETGTSLPTPAGEADWPVLAEMVERHEGAESARLARHWFARQPQGVMVFRGTHHEPLGFLLVLRLEEAGEEERAADPATRAAWEWLARHAPLRRGERATHFRFWMARDAYQAVSATQSMAFLKVTQHYLTTPGLAFTFFPLADEAFWSPFFLHVDLFRVPGADFAVGGRRYAVFGHDWRAVPPMLWLDVLARRELDTTPPEGGAAPAGAPAGERAAVLGEAEFAAAVQEALKCFARPRELRRSPLLRTRLVLREAGVEAAEAERVPVLQALLRRAAEPLRASPRQRRWWDALHHGCFEPAASQERAAQRLYVSFSTFRRHLKAGVDHVAETLWQWELGAGDEKS
ncbi:MAG TPA: hypothetical protein VFX98_18610, partial [Longimicrobiaceae bacterium]|nr:hypothetical protein [Longimicrobiaceae bacterium]